MKTWLQLFILYHACKDLLFTLSVLYKDMVGETKDLNFGLIRQKHR